MITSPDMTEFISIVRDPGRLILVVPRVSNLIWEHDKSMGRKAKLNILQRDHLEIVMM